MSLKIPRLRPEIDWPLTRKKKFDWGIRNNLLAKLLLPTPYCLYALLRIILGLIHHRRDFISLQQIRRKRTVQWHQGTRVINVTSSSQVSYSAKDKITGIRSWKLATKLFAPVVKIEQDTMVSS
jgi:hypothetical protein